MSKAKRILFISNSQGTSAGLGDEFLFSNYPLLVQQMLPEVECRYWLMSYLSVVTVNDFFHEIIMPHQPDWVILQIGIIEAGLRILPKSTRDFLGTIPGGRFITKFLHNRQAKIRKLLNICGIRFLDVKMHQFERHLLEIIKKCESFNFRLLVAKVPLLSEQGVMGIYPGNNRIIDDYNRKITEICSERNVRIVDLFAHNTDSSRDSLYIKDSVHFSIAGHRLIANNLSQEIQNALNI